MAETVFLGYAQPDWVKGSWCRKKAATSAFYAHRVITKPAIAFWKGRANGRTNGKDGIAMLLSNWMVDNIST
jgi:hypothetical protein